MSDIVKRLLKGEPCIEAAGCDGGGPCKVMNASSGCACAEAADEITRLRAENERLGRALNVARYGEADFAWSVHEAQMVELRAENERLTAALAAIEKLALQASIASCTCLTKTPDITFHNPGCRYVLLQYIIAQCEDARAALEGKQ
jgi:hypothetical protein